MKTVYQITIQDPKGIYQNVRVSAATMAVAISAAQKKFAVTTEPTSVQAVGVLDIEA